MENPQTGYNDPIPAARASFVRLPFRTKNSILLQRTLKQAISTKGVGLHSGRRVEITLRPAEPNTGIVFHRVDLPEIVDLDEWGYPLVSGSVSDELLADARAAVRACPRLALRLTD